MRIKNFLNLKDSVDFYDIDVDTDNKQFFDPYLILTDRDQNYLNFKLSIESFFTTVTKNFYEGKEISYLFKHFDETKENRLGLSHIGSFNGNGTGKILSELLESKIKEYLELCPNVFSSLDELSLFIKGISNDRISDITTNICLLDLIDFTNNQIKKYHIDVKYSTKQLYVWDKNLNKWEKRSFDLPLINGDCLILTPKKYCASKIKLGSFHNFVQIGILGYLKENYKYFGIPPQMKLTKDGDYIEQDPTKKSIISYYMSHDIDLFDSNELIKIFSNTELQQIILNFKNKN